jgi:arylformamidase
MKVLMFGLLSAVLSAGLIFPAHADRDGLFQRLKNRNNGKEATSVAAITTRLNVPYTKDGNPKHRLDIYFPMAKEKPLTVLVHIHGGGWKRGDKRKVKQTGMFYAAKGVVFIAPNYRLSPGAVHPSHVEDCAAALAWVFDHLPDLNGDRDRIFLSGHSAGAHLAALVGTDQKYLQQYGLKPNDLAGVISVDTASFNLLSNDNERLVKRLVKQAFGSSKRVLKDASPLYHITDNRTDCTNFLILNTTNRQATARGGKEFAGKLNGAGCNARFIPVDNHSHSDMATGMYNASDPVGSSILQFILSTKM